MHDCRIKYNLELKTTYTQGRELCYKVASAFAHHAKGRELPIIFDQHIFAVCRSLPQDLIYIDNNILHTYVHTYVHT